LCFRLKEESGHLTDVSHPQSSELYLDFLIDLIFPKVINHLSLFLLLYNTHKNTHASNNAKLSIISHDDHSQGVLVSILSRRREVFFQQDDDDKDDEAQQNEQTTTSHYH